MILSGKTIAVGITGGIAAYKACDIVSKLAKEGADVHVVMTDSAQKFVSPLTFETLSKNKVIIKMFDPKREWEVEHISLAKKADLFLVAPCTANMAGKLAGGIADDFLSTTIMACTCPLLIAPAMNTNMLNSQAYKNNEEILKSRGVKFIAPQSGMLACGDKGDGRLASTDIIVDTVIKTLMPNQDLKDKRVLISLGSTREYLDPVRFITNKSSGKMGCALIKAAQSRGADVVAVCGFVTQELPKGCTVVKVESTEEMYKAVLKEEADYYIMSAAPCDFKPKEYNKNKIKSSKDIDKDVCFQFIKNPDIAAAVKDSINKRKSDSKLIIFCAETQDLEKNAIIKMQQKGADMVVANDITKDGAGFDCDTNIVTILTKDKKLSYEKMSKTRLADIIIDLSAKL